MTESKQDWDPTTHMTRDEERDFAHAWADSQRQQITKRVKKGGTSLPLSKKK